MMHNLSEVEKTIKLRNRMIFIYSILVAAVFLLTSFYFIFSYGNTLEKQARIYASSLSLQLQKNVNNYLKRIETAGMILYEDKQCISYYPSDNADKTYEDLQIEKSITDKMITQSLMENYCDFGLVYDNEKHIGKISDGTLDIFDNNIFSTLKRHVVNTKDSVWITNYKNNYNRLYCIKRINRETILVTSIYTDELDNVFEKPDKSSDVRIYLIQDDNHILYASDNSNKYVGEKLPKNLLNIFAKRTNASIIDNDYVGAVTNCENNWRIICCTPSKNILNLESDNQTWLMTGGFSALVICICVGFLAASKYTSRADNLTKRSKSKENLDCITGLLNRLGVEEEISERIETSMVGSTYGFALIKIKNFENFGDDFYNEVLVKLTEKITSLFANSDIVGFNSENQYVVFSDFTDFDLQKSQNLLREKFVAISNELKHFKLDDNKQNVFISMGVCVYPDNGETFDELYNNALQALNVSLESDIENCVFFDTMKKRDGR